MARNSIEVNGTPSDVFDVLLDAEAYPQWVFGAKRMRRVDPEWPEPGAAFYHSVAVGGAIKDKTEILRLESPREILLEAYARPLGIARVLIRVQPEGGRSRITITEFPSPGSMLEKLRQVVDPLIHVRNVFSLRRLRDLVEIRRVQRARKTPRLQAV
ncbi:MAG: SRPBCC family protein [Actinomycetota bacterium]|nr:SRPBCC family protein [Actinomycetota bacterium]